MMHLYSGIPGTESVTGFARKDVATKGKLGGRCRADLYICIYSSGRSERGEFLTWWDGELYGYGGRYTLLLTSLPIHLD